MSSRITAKIWTKILSTSRASIKSTWAKKIYQLSHNESRRLKQESLEICLTKKANATNHPRSLSRKIFLWSAPTTLSNLTTGITSKRLNPLFILILNTLSLKTNQLPQFNCLPAKKLKAKSNQALISTLKWWMKLIYSCLGIPEIA